MTRDGFEALVSEGYGVRADYPFDDDFTTGVFRHSDTGRWFALAMCISERKLGRDGDARIDVVNMKCAPEVIRDIAGAESGIYPAYHMNKMHWLTVALDGSCDDGLIAWLLDISFELTRKKKK
jgi:predicted DNA-binding protein (MmcQ/YjbR family)